MRILAGDIGGTNTRLSIWERDDANRDATPKQVGEIRKFKNGGIASFADVLKEYLATLDPDVVTGITDACCGVAGPVDGRRVKLTNIPHWPEIFADAIAKTLNIAHTHRVTLINDMPAHGSSLASIEKIAPDHIIDLRGGAEKAGGMRAIVMPGTGLGIGMMVWEKAGGVHRALPTEAGHMDLPARDAKTSALIESMRKIFPGQTISREHVISGPGLRAIYACLKNPASPDLASAPAAETFVTIEGTDPIAKQTLDTITVLLGELCGNVALGCLATGGIYLAGSIALKSVRPRLSTPLFKDAFAATGPASMREVIAAVPVKLVLYEETGLLGAATYASWVADGRV